MKRVCVVLAAVCFAAVGCGKYPAGTETVNTAPEEPVSNTQEPADEAGGNGIEWKIQWDNAAETAKEQDKPILLLFTNPEYCPPCRMLEEQTLPDSEVVVVVNKTFVPMKIHTGKSEEKTLGNEFGVQGIPTIIVCDTDKNVIARKTGFAPPGSFLKFLESAASLKNLEKAAEAKPGDIEATFELGQAYHGLDLMEKAKPLLEKVSSLDSDNIEKKKMPALYLLGTIALAMNDIDKAKERFREAADLDPENKSEYADDNALQLALLPAMKEEQDFSSAATSLAQFVENFPESSLRPEAFLYLSQCYMQSGEKEASQEALEELIKEYPGSQEADYAEKMLNPHISQNSCCERR